ncbi:hypothetical protein [Nocardioides sp.]|uniref:hypothetical protein n=1 Tax=Nocardioides sp. TaxID=35761 RepID=UPI0035648264
MRSSDEVADHDDLSAHVDEGPTRLLPTGPGAVLPPPAEQEPAFFIDRAGDALARQPRVLARRAAEIPPHLQAVLAAIAAIVLLIVIAALAA